MATPLSDGLSAFIGHVLTSETVKSPAGDRETEDHLLLLQKRAGRLAADLETDGSNLAIVQLSVCAVIGQAVYWATSLDISPDKVWELIYAERDRQSRKVGRQPESPGQAVFPHSHGRNRRDGGRYRNLGLG